MDDHVRSGQAQPTTMLVHAPVGVTSGPLPRSQPPALCPRLTPKFIMQKGSGGSGGGAAPHQEPGNADGGEGREEGSEGRRRSSPETQLTRLGEEEGGGARRKGAPASHQEPDNAEQHEEEGPVARRRCRIWGHSRNRG